LWEKDTTAVKPGKTTKVEMDRLLWGSLRAKHSKEVKPIEKKEVHDDD